MKLNRHLRSSLTVAATATANLLVVGTVLAAGIGVVAASPGVSYAVQGTAQVTAVANIVGSRVEVSYAAAPAFIGFFPAAMGTSTTLTGPGFRLTCDHAGATPVFTLTHTGQAGFDLTEVRLIGLSAASAKRYCFDRTLPNPGTAGSLTGADIAYLGGAGAWMVGPEYSNRVTIGGVAMNDTYMKLRLRFSVPFVPNNYLRFSLDTDRIY